MTEKPHGGRSRSRRAVRAAGSFGLLALLCLGACRQIFGLDEAVSYTPDTAATDGGAGNPPMDSVTQFAAEQSAAAQPAAVQSAAEQSAAVPSKPSLEVADAASDARCDLADGACAGDAGP